MLFALNDPGWRGAGSINRLTPIAATKSIVFRV
jgi:hypothetical protein